MDTDDLWLRDGDERFARFLRRLGFDHDEAADVAERTRPPWRGWDRAVPRRMLPKNDIRQQVTEMVAMKDGSGYVEAPRRPSPPMPVAGRLRETAEPLPIPPPEGPEYEGPPIIINEERDMTAQITRGEVGYRDR